MKSIGSRMGAVFAVVAAASWAVHTQERQDPSGDRPATPATLILDKAETIEVMQKVDPTHIKVDLTIYDPVDLTRPWTVHRGYVKDDLPNGRIDLWSCEENNNVVKTADGGSQFVLPGEPGYKDPNKILQAPSGR